MIAADCAGILNIHASGLVLDGRGILLRGASGAGKSLLALELLDRAALQGTEGMLVADDRVDLERHGDILIMRHDANGGVQTYAAATPVGGYGAAGTDDPLLKSFDVVYVPQTPIAAVADFAKQYYANLPFSATFTFGPGAATPSVVTPPQQLAPQPPPVVTAR